MEDRQDQPRLEIAEKEFDEEESKTQDLELELTLKSCFRQTDWIDLREVDESRGHVVLRDETKDETSELQTLYMDCSRIELDELVGVHGDLRSEKDDGHRNLVLRKRNLVEEKTRRSDDGNRSEDDGVLDGDDGRRLRPLDWPLSSLLQQPHYGWHSSRECSFPESTLRSEET